jgi:hypothetical protein
VRNAIDTWTSKALYICIPQIGILGLKICCHVGSVNQKVSFPATFWSLSSYFLVTFQLLFGHFPQEIAHRSSDDGFQPHEDGCRAVIKSGKSGNPFLPSTNPCLQTSIWRSTARPDPQASTTGSSSTRAAGVNHPPDSDFGVKNRSNYPPLPSGQTDTAQLGLESIQSSLRHLLGDPRRAQAPGRSLFECFSSLFGHF